MYLSTFTLYILIDIPLVIFNDLLTLITYNRNSQWTEHLSFLLGDAHITEFAQPVIFNIIMPSDS